MISGRRASTEAQPRLSAAFEALELFAAEEPQKAELVKLRCFVGMTLEEAAQTMNIPQGTANAGGHTRARGCIIVVSSRSSASKTPLLRGL